MCKGIIYSIIPIFFVIAFLISGPACIDDQTGNANDDVIFPEFTITIQEFTESQSGKVRAFCPRAFNSLLDVIEMIEIADTSTFQTIADQIQNYLENPIQAVRFADADNENCR